LYVNLPPLLSLPRNPHITSDGCDTWLSFLYSLSFLPRRSSLPPFLNSLSRWNDKQSLVFWWVLGREAPFPLLQCTVFVPLFWRSWPQKLGGKLVLVFFNIFVKDAIRSHLFRFWPTQIRLWDFCEALACRVLPM